GLLFNGLFPRVLIATDSAHSLLIKTAANSKLTLEVMTIVALILLPIALVYIIWSYVVFRRRIKVNQNA
ncbi:MAG: cytochrome d ubiquinol oxidase subunit II, partial [Lactobacillus gasseri]|nr:cytochrome d ubiquinol oxidase subunit II [Lactobacillus gasseri]